MSAAGMASPTQGSTPVEAPSTTTDFDVTGPSLDAEQEAAVNDCEIASIFSSATPLDPAASCSEAPPSLAVSAEAYSPPWRLLSTARNARFVAEGGVLFAFCCRTGYHLTSDDARIIDDIINLSAFSDEVEQNNVPHVDVSDVIARRNDPSAPEPPLKGPTHGAGTVQLGKLTVIVVKTMYMLPGVKPDDPRINVKFVASVDYHRRCQPRGTTIWDPAADQASDTFRMTKAIVPFVYSLTVQMRVSEVTDPAARAAVCRSDLMPDSTGAAKDGQWGGHAARIFLIERTKRNMLRTDATLKCKSTIAMYPVKGGTLLSHTTVALNGSIPRVAAAILQNLGRLGTREAAETCLRTRTYMCETLLGLGVGPKKGRRGRGRKAREGTPAGPVVRSDEDSKESSGSERDAAAEAAARAAGYGTCETPLDGATAGTEIPSKKRGWFSSWGWHGKGKSKHAEPPTPVETAPGSQEDEGDG